MKQVVRIMDDLGEKRVCEDGIYKKKCKKMKQKILTMSDEIYRLKVQLDNSKPVA